MTQRDEGVIRRRTPAEREAYIQGLRAGANIVSNCLATSPGLDANHHVVRGVIERAKAHIELAAQE